MLCPSALKMQFGCQVQFSSSFWDSTEVKYAMQIPKIRQKSCTQADLAT